MQRVEESERQDIPTLVIVGAFFLVAAAPVWLIGFPLFRPGVRALAALLVVIAEILPYIAVACLVGFLVGLPFCLLARLGAEASEERDDIPDAS